MNTNFSPAENVTKSLLFAIKKDKANDLEVLLRTTDIDISAGIGKNERTLLHEAVCRQSINCLKVLLQHNANVDARNKNGKTPLHYAAGLDFSEAIELLLKAGADPNIQSKNGNTPLHCAVDKNAMESVKILVNHGAYVNVQNKHFNTPLIFAVDNMEIACILLEKGANPYICNDEGASFLDYVRDEDTLIVKNYLKN